MKGIRTNLSYRCRDGHIAYRGSFGAGRSPGAESNQRRRQDRVLVTLGRSSPTPSSITKPTSPQGILLSRPHKSLPPNRRLNVYPFAMDGQPLRFSSSMPLAGIVYCSKPAVTAPLSKSPPRNSLRYVTVKEICRNFSESLDEAQQ